MKNLIRVAGAIALFFLVWNIVVDYGDSVISGTYHLAQNSETSTLVLKPDHSFQQELTKLGKVERATGTWRHIGAGAGTWSGWNSLRRTPQRLRVADFYQTPPVSRLVVRQNRSSLWRQSVRHVYRG